MKKDSDINQTKKMQPIYYAPYPGSTIKTLQDSENRAKLMSLMRRFGDIIIMKTRKHNILLSQTCR